MRYCEIVSGSVGMTEEADDDGAYDLHRVAGTPEEVGKAIAESLATCDLFRCGAASWAVADRHESVYLALTIRIDPAPVVVKAKAKGQWRDVGEGPWLCAEDAERFRVAEVGAEPSRTTLNEQDNWIVQVWEPAS